MPAHGPETIKMRKLPQKQRSEKINKTDLENRLDCCFLL